MNVPDLHRRAAERFGDLVQAVKEDQWADPTPCADWNVRALVNHVVAENLWTPMLFGGSTVEEIGDRFDGDVLGTDPKAAWESSITAALKAVQSQGAMDRTVHLSFGDVPGREYAAQLFADYLVHSFDLARAIGGDERLDPELTAACTQWFASVEDAYRSAGLIGERPEIAPDADSQTTLLAMFGRKP